MIPPRARSFQYRTESGQVREAAACVGTVVPRQVLVGAGGVGKTQLAADYARAALQSGSVDLLVWVSATTRSAAVSGYAQAAVEVLGADPVDPEHAARSFLAWLEPKADVEPCRWLVVLDDVADPADLHGLWPQDSPRGRTLVTTRRRDPALTGEGRRVVPVGLFTPAEAFAYLEVFLAAHGLQEDPQQLEALAADLGHLPLALSQAAAYLVHADLDCATYRQLLADRTSRLGDLVPDRLPDEQTAPVAATWALSIERADQLRPTGLARPLLRLAAMLDPNGIPDTVLTSAPTRAHLSAARDPAETVRPPGRRRWPWKRQRKPTQITDGELASALRALHSLSLIDHDPGTPHRAVRVHQLIQRAVRDTLPADQRDHIAKTAADALIDAWPDIETDTDLAQALRANVEALAGHTRDPWQHLDGRLSFFRAWRSRDERLQMIAVAKLLEPLLRVMPDRPDILDEQSQLARLRGEAGDAASAAIATARVVERIQRMLGPDHPDTLTARAYLARWREEAGDADSAADALTELLPSLERVLGPDHPTTLNARGALALRRWAAEDVVDAATASDQVLGRMVEALGADHPTTLQFRNTLNYLRTRANDADPPQH